MKKSDNTQTGQGSKIVGVTVKKKGGGTVVCGRWWVSAAGQASTCPSQTTPTRSIARAYIHIDAPCSFSRAQRRGAVLWRRVARGPSSVTIRPARGIPRNARRNTSSVEKSGDLRARAHTLVARATISSRERIAPRCDATRRCIEKGESARLAKPRLAEASSRNGSGRRKRKGTVWGRWVDLARGRHPERNSIVMVERLFGDLSVKFTVGVIKYSYSD